MSEIWKNRKQIVEGLKNSIFTSEHIEEIAKSRLNICLSCENYDTSGESCVVKGAGVCCKSCGCILHMKTRCLSCKCPLGKWNALLTEKDVEKNQDKLYPDEV